MALREWRLSLNMCRASGSFGSRGVSSIRAFYLLDSTTLDLYYSLFSWARFRRNRGVVMMHTHEILEGSI